MQVKICVLGHFGLGKNLINGQTVKTKIITEELKNFFGEKQVNEIDTSGGIKTIFKAPFQSFCSLKNSENAVIFPAHNGLRVYAPMLIFFNRFFKKKLHYVVIGGWLPDFLEKRRHLSKCLKHFDGIYVETNVMKKVLEAQGFDNIFVMPNCKRLTVLNENELVYPQGIPFRLCTFSRVMKEKGIEDAVNAVKSINEEYGKTVYTLDIFGQVDEEQTEWFENLKKSFPDYISYGGLVPFEKSVETIKKYFALLFPTYYDGEGFAGTLIDSFSAGVPVIATDWKYNTEIVNENVGFLYRTGNNKEFEKILKRLSENPSELLKKKRFCLKEAKKYGIDKSVKTLIDRLEVIGK